MGRDCSVHIFRLSPSLHTVGHQARLPLLQHGLRGLRQLRGRVCLPGIPLKVGRVQVAAVVAGKVGRKRSYNLGSFNGRSYSHQVVLASERGTKPEQEWLDQNSISDTGQCVYQSETHGHRGGVVAYQDPVNINQGHFFVGGFIDRAEGQLQVVIVVVGPRCGEDQVSCDAVGVQVGHFRQLQPL